MERITALFFLFFIFSSYTPEEEIPEYTPVLMTRQALETSVKFCDPVSLEKPGKIYTTGNLLFINERYRGIHIVDNSNPSAPVIKGFVSIPGCVDMAVKNSILYADNAVDLVVINFSDQQNIRVVKRIKNAFPELLPPGYNYIPWQFSAENRPANTIIVGWEKLN